PPRRTAVEAARAALSPRDGTVSVAGIPSAASLGETVHAETDAPRSRPRLLGGPGAARRPRPRRRRPRAARRPARARLLQGEHGAAGDADQGGGAGRRAEGRRGAREAGSGLRRRLPRL